MAGRRVWVTRDGDRGGLPFQDGQAGGCRRREGGGTDGLERAAGYGLGEGRLKGEGRVGRGLGDRTGAGCLGGAAAAR